MFTDEVRQAAPRAKVLNRERVRFEVAGGNYRLVVALACWGAAEGTEVGDKLEVLAALVELYEAKRWPVDTAESFDPIDVLRHAIEELGQHPGRARRAPGIAVARIGNSLSPAPVHR
jgi:hypothetical protein